MSPGLAMTSDLITFLLIGEGEKIRREEKKKKIRVQEEAGIKESQWVSGGRRLRLLTSLGYYIPAQK